VTGIDTGVLVMPDFRCDIGCADVAFGNRVTPRARIDETGLPQERGWVLMSSASKGSKGICSVGHNDVVRAFARMLTFVMIRAGP